MENKVKVFLGIVSLVIIIFGTHIIYNVLYASYTKNQKVFDVVNEISSEEGLVLDEDSSSKNVSVEEDVEEQNNTNAEDEKLPAPDFTITDIDGNEVKLSSFFGKPVVLNFWASWCSPCKDELPDFEKVYLGVEEEVTFLMVNLADGYRETVSKGSKFIADNGYSFPVYYDTTQEAAYTYGIISIPTTLFIDKDGYIVTGHKGQMDENMLRKGISFIL